MSKEHEVITRPYNSMRFVDAESSNLVEIDVVKVKLYEEQFCNFDELYEDMDPAEITDELIETYLQKFNDLDNKPNLYFHLIKTGLPGKENPSLQLFRSDVSLGNLRKDGFYRKIINATEIDRKKVRKQIKEITRYLRAEIIKVKGVYCGFETSTTTKSIFS